MFGRTCALSAMLMVVAVSCTFDRAGTGPDLVGTPDAGGEVTKPDGSDGSSPENDALADGADRAADGGSSIDASVDVSTEQVDVVARPDAVTEADASRLDAGGSDVSSNEVGPPPPDAPAPADSGVDGADPAREADAPDSCAGFPNAHSFTPPEADFRHCYWYEATASNWLGAANSCASARGHLATLSSSAETAFAVGLVPAFAPATRVWIGGTDGRFSADGPGSGPFSWITGEPMTYTNWFSDASTQEPNGRCESCTGSPCYCEHRIAIMNDGRWEDLYEAVPSSFLCEAE